MANLFVRLCSLARDERGEDLIEYALLAALIAIFCIAALVNASGEVNAIWGEIATNIAKAMP